MAQSLEQISLKKSERGFITGASGFGKSTLAEQLIAQFYREYGRAKILVVDSKPRFMAKWQPNGLSAARLYKRWDHGAKLPDSVLLQTGAEPTAALKAAWKHERIALCQTDNRADIGWSVACISAFLRDARKGQPRLVYVDEGLDFFHSNSISRGGDDAILRVARAGRERGVSLLFGSQRPRGIPLQTMTEMTKLYMFHLDYMDDVKHLQDMGYPAKGYPAPEDKFVFRYWDKNKYKDPPPLMKLRV